MTDKLPNKPNPSASIGKNDLWVYICRSKFLPNIHSSHILSVITIFFEELKDAMIDGEKIKIPNFLTFYIDKAKPRKHYSYLTKKVEQADSKFHFKIKLAPKLKNLLKKMIDKDKTFGNSNK